MSAAGLRVTAVEPHPQALTRMLRQIDARLELLRITVRPRLEAAGLDLDRAGPILDAAHEAVRADTLGYVLITAEKP